MGFIAPLTDESDDFAVEHMDVRLWCLAGFLGMGQRIYLDVGLAIRAVTAVEALGLALPFWADVDYEGVRNLRGLIPGGAATTVIGRGAQIIADDENGTTAEMIQFGVGAPMPFRDVRVSTATVSRVPNSQNTYRYRLPLERSLRPDELAYVRVRFDVTRTHRAVVWKRTGLTHNGAVFELLFANVSEIFAKEDRANLSAAVVPVRDLLVEMMVRASWQPRQTIPPNTGTRLLEKDIWVDYLDRRIDTRNEGFIVVYEWHLAGDATYVSGSNPTAVFLNVSRESPLMAWGNFPRVMLMVGAATVMVSGVGDGMVHDLFMDLAGSFGTAQAAVKVALGVLTTVGVSLVAVSKSGIANARHLLPRLHNFERKRLLAPRSRRRQG